MTTGNTALLGLALPVEGELDGVWGDTVNQSITSLVDSAVAGTTTLSADADVTLTDTALAANQARQAVLLWTASNGASTRNVTAPARSKPYIVINAGTGSIVLRGAGPTTGVTIIAGEKCLAAWNGSDFVKVSTSTAAAGDVVGPGSATDGNLAAFDGTTGKLIKQAATVTVAQGGTGVTTSTGTGNVVLSDSPTLVTPALGTPASGNLSNATADGTNAVGYRNIPAVADKTTAYTLAVGDVGKVVGVGSGGSIEIPDTTFAAGDAVLVFNNTTGDITITCTITTAYIAGADADVASVTLATRGVCNILFISGTVCVITGNIS